MTVHLNSAMIEKTIETTDFLSGGVLNPEQQRSFVVLLKRFSTLLGRTRSVRMPQAQMEIDKLHVSEPITRAANENTAVPSTNKVKVNQITLNAKKTISDWNITTETLQQSIEGDSFELTIMRAMTNQIAQDMERLAIMGDTSLVGNDVVSQLLKTIDGWFVQAQSAHVLDVGGASIQRGIFSEMKRMLPKQYRSDPNLRFIMSDTLVTDWQNLLAGALGGAGAVGADAVAAAAFTGGNSAAAGLAPFGIPIIRVPMIPDDLPVAAGAAASPAMVDGIAYSPYRIVVGANNVLDLTLSGTAVQVVFPESKVYDLVEVVAIINAAIAGSAAAGAFRAEDNGENKIRLRSIGTGVAQSITVGPNPTSTANETLGFPTAGIGPVTGSAGNGTVLEGSFIMLCNPLNLVWGMLDATRIFTEYNKNNDRIETVVYNQVDAKIENPDALVLATGVRRAQLII